MTKILHRHFPAALGMAMAFAMHAFAQEAVIRKNLAERMPDLPKIDEVNKSPVPGIYEVRMGTNLLYTDQQGDYVFEGQISESRTGTNLTQAKIDKLTAVDFATLPFRDAIVEKRGTGARKLAVFSDPGCGYCKKLEANLDHVKDVTVYTFVNAILGEESTRQARNIWCAKDKTRTWHDWMVGHLAPAEQQGACDTSVLDRNLAMARKLHISATPSLVFENGKRLPGGVPLDEIERHLDGKG